VGKIFRAFYREQKIVRRIVEPFAEARRTLQRIECAIDLDRIYLAAGIFEFATLRQAFWIKYATPRRVSPTGNANTYLVHSARYSLTNKKHGPA
jgi:hypothetical protein